MHRTIPVENMNLFVKLIKKVSQSYKVSALTLIEQVLLIIRLVLNLRFETERLIEFLISIPETTHILAISDLKVLRLLMTIIRTVLLARIAVLEQILMSVRALISLKGRVSRVLDSSSSNRRGKHLEITQ